MAAVGLGAVAVVLEWPPGAVVGVVALGVVAHARFRGHGEDAVLESLYVDATALALALLVARPPGLVVIPPLACVVLVACLLATAFKAVRLASYAIAVTAGSLLFIEFSDAPVWSASETLLLVVLAVVSMVPGVFLVLRAVRRAVSDSERLLRRLEDREERYRGLVEGVPVGMYRSTPEGRLLAANPALAQLLGYTDADELIRTGVGAAYTDPAIREVWKSIIDREGTVREWEMPLTRRDGEVIWVRDTAHVTRDDNGKALYYEGMVEDVTDRRRAEEALKESEDRYRRLVEGSPMPIAVHCEGVIVYANRATADLVGAASPDEILGRPVMDFVHPDDRAVVAERMRRVIEDSDRVPVLEERFLRLDGAVIEVEVVGIPIEYQGNPASQVMVRDVTAHKRAEEEARERNHELERLFALTGDINAGRSVSENLDGIFETFRELIPYDRVEYADLEEDGRVLRTRWLRADYEDLALREGHAYRRSDAINTAGAKARPFIDNDLVAYARSKPEDNPTRLLVREGLRSSLSCPLVLRGEVIGYLFFAARVPGAYRPAHATLVHRVAGQIAAALEQSRLREELVSRNQELERLNHSRTQFLANVSHELRTPLTAVVGLAAEMRDNLEHLSALEVTDFASLIASSSSEVSGIVDDLLVIARAEAGQLSVISERIDLREVIREALDTWNHEESSVLDIVGGDAEAWADPMRVRQIVRNLCSNARRYGGERIELRIGTSAATSYIVVADSGPGIPVSEREAIFQAYIGAGADRTRSSVGLGLTVSRQLAQTMGGDLTYRYEDGESQFKLELPARAPDLVEMSSSSLELSQ